MSATANNSHATTSLRLPAELLERVRRVAEHDSRSVSAEIRLAIRKHVLEHEAVGLIGRLMAAGHDERFISDRYHALLAAHGGERE